MLGKAEMGRTASRPTIVGWKRAGGLDDNVLLVSFHDMVAVCVGAGTAAEDKDGKLIGS